VPLPPIPDLTHTRDQAKQISDNFQKLQDLLLPPTLGSRAAAYFFASTMVVANAAVAGATQSAGASASARHLAATAIFLLKKFQVPDAGLNLAAAKLWSQEPDNAFFAFLAAGRSQKVDDLIRAACPYDPQSTEPRFQWVWERSVSVDAGQQSMYWDCIFMADLALQGIRSPPNKMGNEISNLLPPVLRDWRNFKSAMSDLENVIKAVLDEKGRLSDAAEALKQQLDYLKKVAAALADHSIPKVNPDGSVTLPPPPGAVGPTVEVSPQWEGPCSSGPCLLWLLTSRVGTLVTMRLGAPFRNLRQAQSEHQLHHYSVGAEVPAPGSGRSAN
jgi:hypothetical protein